MMILMNNSVPQLTETFDQLNNYIKQDLAPRNSLFFEASTSSSPDTSLVIIIIFELHNYITGLKQGIDSKASNFISLLPTRHFQTNCREWG